VTVTPGRIGMNAVAVDRTSLSDGIYAASVTVQSNGGTASVPVRLTVSRTVAQGGDVGPVYVLAVDAATRQTVAQYVTDASSGYAFELSLETGDYELVAGTDMDANDFLGDEGEAYGAFPLTSAPRVLTVDRDLTGLAFPVRFEFALGRSSTRTATLKAAAPRTVALKAATPGR
jgi:serine protease